MISVHLLAVLAIVDHFKRTVKGSNKFAAGVLLGQKVGLKTVVTSAFGVPFDSDGAVWFFDHTYAENMQQMLKKVSAKEQIVGWYHTDSRLHSSDSEVHLKIEEMCKSPVLLTMACNLDGQMTGYTFKGEFEQVASVVVMDEAESVGREVLLKDVEHGDVKVDFLSSMEKQLNEIVKYKGSDIEIQHLVQQVFGVLQKLKSDKSVHAAISERTNNLQVLEFLGASAKAIINLQNLIESKEEKEEKETTTNLKKESDNLENRVAAS